MSRRKSETQKQKEGTQRVDRRKRVKKTAISGYPDPGIDLTQDEAEIYKRICDHLRIVDSLYDVDTYIIVQATTNIAQMYLAIKKLREEGAIQYFDNGTRNVSPEYSIFEKCSNLFRNHSKMLGLDPLSRAGLSIFLDIGEAASDDPSEGIM